MAAMASIVMGCHGREVQEWRYAMCKMASVIVLKTGLDRPVGPVEPGAGQVSGPIIATKPVF